MADKVLCDKSDLVNIADAVRSKLGVTNTYYVSELSSAIQNIQTGGGGGGVETCTLTTSVRPGCPHGVIQAYNGDTFIEITSAGTYSINKNSIIFVMFSYIDADTYTGLYNLYYSFIDNVMVCKVTSDIATYNFTRPDFVES